MFAVYITTLVFVFKLGDLFRIILLSTSTGLFILFFFFADLGVSTSADVVFVVRYLLAFKMFTFFGIVGKLFQFM